MPRTFRISILRYLLGGGWLWAGSLLGVTGVMDTNVIESVACWIIAVGAPLGLLATATTSLTVDHEAVTYRRLRETVVFPAAASSVRLRAVGRMPVIELSKDTGRTRVFSLGFMSKADRRTLIDLVLTVLPHA